MKKGILIAAGVLIILLAGALIASGGKISTVYISDDISVSADGRSMTLRASVMSSIGYIRTCRARQEGEALYLTFYSTFGFNSSLGARSTFTVNSDPSCTEIYVYGGEGGYRLALVKDAVTGAWARPGTR